ncbi:MAG: MGH1-like glycoside hydrolase domain-containing protein [Bryobacteraceae bacterium]
MSAEQNRLLEDAQREKNWKRWGPYLSERQWGTVREDYSAEGTCWDYLPHDQARSRAYRWGEDGLLGICDREGRLCFALAMWNGQDPILKERLFGLTGPEGNHGEDVKECYFYLDSTPTHSYLKGQYKYPQRAFPYEWLVEENGKRGKDQREFELLDTGIFDGDRYFDITVEYAKAGPDDLLIRVGIENRGPEDWLLHFLPTLWFRNTWSWGRTGEGYWPKPQITREDSNSLVAEHASLGKFHFASDRETEFLFTGNETNTQRLFGYGNGDGYVKDAFDSYVVHGRKDAVNPQNSGTKAAAYYKLNIPAGKGVQLRFRLSGDSGGAGARPDFGADFDSIFEARIREADDFYSAFEPRHTGDLERQVVRQAYASLLWTKQFYYYAVQDWLEGDPSQPAPPESRWDGRNSGWLHLFNRDVISMPDNWEYPWYAAWDLAFHMIPFAQIDPEFAKEQLVLLLREWYTNPNGQMPAYEFAFSDVNPPVHAWACWRVYKISAPHGERDRIFLERVFQKLLINFTWWVNRKDIAGKQVFSGGFLGLDNIGIFDRSKPLPQGQVLEQADGTAWMAFYCSTMLSMALELASEDPAYEDVASKFFEHFVAIADAMNGLGGFGLWDEEDGFYYDQLLVDGRNFPLKIRSLVGVTPLFAVDVLEDTVIERLPGFRKRMQWFLTNRKDLMRQISLMQSAGAGDHGHALLAIPSQERLTRVLRRVLDEGEFLSPFGIRSVSKIHREHPYVLHVDGDERRVDYEPGESRSGLFGGNSNWRGPIWFPMNYLLIEALERYHHFYGDEFRVECPVGSGEMKNLREVAKELNARLTSIFLPDETGWCPWQAELRWFADNPHWKNMVWFYEYFDGDTGRGCGASHQTGWTALIARCLEDLAGQRSG